MPTLKEIVEIFLEVPWKNNQVRFFLGDKEVRLSTVEHAKGESVKIKFEEIKKL